uniref:non-specific serine/threonine protein kinase n=1 Tax=Populus alba TaxID=43335 RepID=A0A4V6ACK4_POPAL|nr:hypothetical protein D5086_0000023030 [Populus alba]
MPDVIAYFLSNFTSSLTSISVSNPTSKLNGPNLSLSDFSNTRIRLDVEGELQCLSYNTSWCKLWWEPRDKCSVYNACGNFGSCNLYNKLACRCLPGFEPQSLENWKKKVFSSGCRRSSDACGKKDTFLSLKTMKFGQPDSSLVIEDEKQCREECLRNCQCQAHSFVKGEVNMRRDEQPTNNTCLIWDDLKDLQEEYSHDGPDLFVRVAIADIESKAKSCEPCGINVIPYPLSNGSDCGDPMYSSFYCDNSTGKLSFKTHNGTYNVTTINQDTRTFVIQEKDVDDCNASTRGQIRKFNTSFPFKVNSSKRWCDSNVSSQGLVEIVIGWEPPQEPVCSSSSDCDDWPNSTCNKKGNGTARCLCNSNFWWDGNALNCVHVFDGQAGGYSRKKKPLSLIVGVAIATVIVLSSIFLYICILMRKKAKRRESQQNTERNAAVLYGTEKRVKNLMDAEELCNLKFLLSVLRVPWRIQNHLKKAQILALPTIQSSEGPRISASYQFDQADGYQWSRKSRKTFLHRFGVKPRLLAMSDPDMIKEMLCSFLDRGLVGLPAKVMDNMTSSTTPVRDEMGETLVSSGERFQLGFFTPYGRNDGKRYLGIWYYGYSPLTVVWVANRENPLDNSRGVFSLGQDGNLQVMDGNRTSYWSARIESTSSSSSFTRRLKLMDSGNLVLIQEAANGSAILWQSFDYPTDTFLPGMKINKNFMLTSWKSPSDPASGDFKFQLDERENQYIIMKNGSIPHWKSGVSGSFVRSDERLWLVSNLLMNSSRKPSRPHGNTTTTEESPYNRINSIAMNYTNTRLVMNFNGQIQFFLWRKAN